MIAYRDEKGRACTKEVGLRLMAQEMVGSYRTIAKSYYQSGNYHAARNAIACTTAMQEGRDFSSYVRRIKKGITV